MSSKITTPPKYLLDWLSYTDMLTDKLKQSSDNVQLTLLSQQQQRLTWWDRYYLGISENEIVQREIVVTADAVPCWFARTVIPTSTFSAHQTVFSRLKTDTLGDIIFGNYPIHRNYLRNYSITKKNIELYWVLQHLEVKSSRFWVRLSEFAITADVFYLLEVFLPGMESFAK